jgi:hypothetical protein
MLIAGLFSTMANAGGQAFARKSKWMCKGIFYAADQSRSYRLYAPVGFGRARTLTIVTGNATLDSRLKNLVFKRKHRITYCVVGLS